MNTILKSFLPTAAKILGLIIILVLIVSYSFVPPLTNPQSCNAGCTVELGFPLKFVSYGMGGQTQGFMNYNFVNLIIDLAIIYFGLCLLSLVANLGRKKENVPDSNSGGRSSSPPDQVGV
jgi:hypothetical protein